MAIMDPGKSAIAVVKTNVVGAVVGVGVTYLGIKKFTSIRKWWMVIGLSVLGGYAGAYAQKSISAKSGSKKSSQEAIKK